jgi:toxin ParE1/3/4
VRLLFRPEAVTDLEEIHDYIAEDNLKKAKDFIVFLRKKCLFLANNPFTGRARPEIRHDLRSFPVKRYLILYRILDEVVEVVSIIHGSRDIETFLENR